MVLPPFLLSLQCVLALVLAKDINAKIRLLINIFTAETLSSFSFFFMYLRWPARFINEEGTSYKLMLSLNNLTCRFVEIFRLLFISCQCLRIHKAWRQEVEWYIIVPYIAVAWTVVTTTVGVLEEYRAQNIGGFCSANIFSASYIGMAVSLTVGAMLFLSVELIFCILTVAYMK